MLVAALLVTIVTTSIAQVSQSWDVDADSSRMLFHVTHKFHHVTGRSEKLQGRARILPGGRVQADMRVPALSFVTGNVQRDSAMREAIEAARYPEIQLKVVARQLAIPTTFPATMSTAFDGQLTFHGVTKTVDVPVSLSFPTAGWARARAQFTFRMSEYGVKRPSLMMIKVNDEVNVDVDVAFRAQSLAPSRASAAPSRVIK